MSDPYVSYVVGTADEQQPKLYEDRNCQNYLTQILQSAEKRGLTIFWAVQNRKSQTTGRAYKQRTIVALQNGEPTLNVRCNRKGYVFWDEIGSYYRPFYELEKAVEHQPDSASSTQGEGK